MNALEGVKADALMVSVTLPEVSPSSNVAVRVPPEDITSEKSTLSVLVTIVAEAGTLSPIDPQAATNNTVMHRTAFPQPLILDPRVHRVPEPGGERPRPGCRQLCLAQ